jgi:hypothetical protein
MGCFVVNSKRDKIDWQKGFLSDRNFLWEIKEFLIYFSVKFLNNLFSGFLQIEV